MPALRQTPLLRARVSPDGKRIIWHGVDGKRWDTVKLFLKDQEVEITIGKWCKKRSLKQNAFLWAVVNPMVAEAAGYQTSEEAHDALRMHFLLKHGDDGKLPTIGSTAELSTVEFNDYIAKVQQLAAEQWGIYVPDPNEVIKE